jgi:hypothetical protein
MESKISYLIKFFQNKILIKWEIKNINHNQGLMACAYSPSYSGGRDQKDQGSKPAWGNSS